MTDRNIEAKVREVFALVLDKELPADHSLRRADEPAWDSVRHVELIFALEDEFDLRFLETEIAEIDSAAAAISVVERHRIAA